MNLSGKILTTMVCLLMACGIFQVNLEAGTEFQVDFSSRYIWRGFDLNPQNQPVLQPSITHSFGDSGFSVNVWGSFSFENKELHEADLTLSYDFKTAENFSLSIGLIHYGWYFTEGFDFGDHTTQEIYITAGLPKVILGPSLSVYYDFNNGDGFYVSLGLGHSVQLSDQLNLDLSASLGYNGEQWIDESGFSDLNLGLSVPFKIDKISISPFVKITFVLMDAVNPEVDNEFAFGASLVF